MNRVKLLISSAAALALPFAVSAQTFHPSGGLFGQTLRNVVEFSNSVLIPFLLAIGFLVFVFGMFWYFIAGGANDEKKEKGKSLIIYAVIGFVVIFVFWGLINLLATSTGLNKQTIDPGLIPKGPNVP